MDIPKKQDNVAEYLLYLWQVEDLLRACALDIERVKRQILEPMHLADEDFRSRVDEYEGVIWMMKSERIQQQGHLQISKNVIIELTDLHLRLLKDPKASEYIAVYHHTLPHIVALRAKSGGIEMPELETCFTAVYGYLLLKLQKKEISRETQQAVEQISALLRMLSEQYRKERYDN